MIIGVPEAVEAATWVVDDGEAGNPAEASGERLFVFGSDVTSFAAGEVWKKNWLVEYRSIYLNILQRLWSSHYRYPNLECCLKQQVPLYS